MGSAARVLNLLPPERRAALQRQRLLAAAGKVLRSVAAGVTLLVVSAAGLTVGLWGLAAAASLGTEGALREELAAYGVLRETVDRHNRLLQEATELGNDRMAFSYIIHNLLTVLPEGVRIDALQVSDEGLTLVFSGTAPQRATVVLLETKLRSLPWAAEVFAPAGNLIARDNPSYEFRLTINSEAARLLTVQ